MSYPRNLDEIAEERLREELARREQARDNGLCDYCGRPGTSDSCQFPERHNKADKEVDHTYDPAPERQWQKLASGLLVPDIEVEVVEHEGEVRKLDTTKWQVECVDGAEVLSTPPGLTYEEALDATNWPEGFQPEPVIEEDIEGATVLIPGMFGGLGVYKVEAGTDGLVARSRDTLGMLSYKADSRQCWTCWGFANLAGIKRLELER
jgi:hypothetical protein